MLQRTQQPAEPVLPKGTCGVRFDRKADPHGRRTFFDLREIERRVERHREQARDEDWDALIGRLLEIADSGKRDPFPVVVESLETGESANHWDGVHLLIGSLLVQALVVDDELSRLLVNRHDREIADILWYLLGCAYGEPDLHGEGSGPGIAPDDTVGQAIDASSILRYRVYEASWALLVSGIDLGRAESDPARAGIGELIREFVKRERDPENMAVVGRHFLSIYWRDKKFGRELMPLVFPEEVAKEHLYIAAWTGYLLRYPAEAVLDDPDIYRLYRRGLALDPSVSKPHDLYYHDDYVTGVAVHMAIAHMYFEKFGLDSELVSVFLRKDDATQIARFIDHIGRQTIATNLKVTGRLRERLSETWRWILDNHKEPRTLKHFGTWVNANNGLYDTAELVRLTLDTLEMTKGTLDWEYGIIESMGKFKEHDPEAAVAIRRKLVSKVHPLLWGGRFPHESASSGDGRATRGESLAAQGSEILGGG